MGIPGAVDLFFLIELDFIEIKKNLKNGKVILDLELEKCTGDFFTLNGALPERSGQCLYEWDWIWPAGETGLEVCF